MKKETDTPTNTPVEKKAETAPATQAQRQTLTEQLKGEMAKWQTKMDEAKVQLHLGAKEAQDKIQPHIDKLEKELSQAEKQWEELETVAEGAWQEIHRGLRLSLKSMQQAFEKAEQHFQKKEEK